MRLALAALLASMVAVPTWAASPQYGAFPAEPAFTGRAAPLILDTADAKTYRTRLREGVAQRPNFDGHYSFVTWGCGSGCEMGAVVDQITGRVAFVPFSMCCADSYFSEPDFDYMKFRRDSRLIVFTGKRDEEGPEGRYFYTFENGQFRAIASASAKVQASDPPVPSTPVCRDLHLDENRLACYDKQAGH
ncbi:hypothetical protein D3273_27165 [Lichenibacterium minor]|uniref:Lipoprotein n=1 Tax=Lichenibacterium minor TaxID=2316528 RepID=A0A4Q2U1Y8_9HYPH|nr:hypothetical protein [Lichenibacterium minor]RYC28847.1 hypothetical protein D3273_27165 [Lichenibacterium minor]